MNIKKQLLIVIFFIFCASIVFSISIHLSLQNYREAVRKTGISTHIVSDVFERRLLADDYLLYAGDRAKEQWLAKHQSLKELIASSEDGFNDPEEKELVNRIKEKINTSKNVFQQIVEGESEVATISAVITNTNIRLASQLSRTAQETISAASRLYELNNKAAEKDLQQILWLFSAAASLFFALLFGSFWIIWRSANKLDQSNRRFELVSKATNDITYEWNIQTNALWFSDAIQKQFGYSKDQIVWTLDWWSKKIHPEDSRRINTDLDALIKNNNQSISLQYRFLKADGTYADVLDRGFIARDEDGKALRLIGAIQDITKQKVFEDELKKRTDEAERLNKITIERELKMIELKDKVKSLEMEKNKNG